MLISYTFCFAVEPSLIQKKENKKTFFYDGVNYIIDLSKKVDCIGDFFEMAKVIYIDKNLPEKFHEGIAVHEIEERKSLKQGHSYGWSHNRAQAKELAFYKKKYGEEAENVMREEEELIDNIFLKYIVKDLEELKLKKKSFIKCNRGFTEPISKMTEESL